MTFLHKLTKRLAVQWPWLVVVPAFAACSADGSLHSLAKQDAVKAPAPVVSAPAIPVSAATVVATAPSSVGDLSVIATSDTSATLSLTQVSDGNGSAASYEVRYALAPIGWGWGSATAVSRGTCAAPLIGTAVGSNLSCTVYGLVASTAYNFQLIPFRGTLNVNAVFGALSNAAAGTTTAPGAVVASVTVTPASANLLVGGSQQFTAATLSASGAALAGKIVTWSSSNAAVASVSQSGLVLAVSAGSANIVATSGGKSAQAAVAVAVVPPVTTAPGNVADLSVSAVSDTSATLSFTQVTDGAGKAASYDVRYAVAPISWGSGSEVVRGTCTTPLAGTTAGSNLKCTVFGLSASTSYNFQLVSFRGTLNVNAVFGSISNTAAASTIAKSGGTNTTIATVTVTPGSSSSTVGQSVQFSAAEFNSAGVALSGNVATWSSSNTAVMTVNQSGLASAVSAGSANIVATSGGKSGQAAATVTAVAVVPVASVTVSPSTMSVVAGSSQQYTSIQKDAAGNTLSGRVVTYTSSNSLTASVSTSGMAKGLVAGSITVTATSEGKTGTAAFTVTAAAPPPSGGWANEPTGMTVITDASWQAPQQTTSDVSFGTNGWNSISNSSSLIQDSSAPTDANVLSFPYPIGMQSGTAPGTIYRALPSIKTIYAGFYWKVSNPWQGDGSNVNKLAFFGAGNSGNMVLVMYGPPGGPFELNLIPEYAGVNPYWTHGGNSVTLGVWHKVEVLFDSGAGRYQWWLDGVKLGDFIQATPGPFTQFEFSPTWGGIGDTKRENDFYYFGRTHISGQ